MDTMKVMSRSAAVSERRAPGENIRLLFDTEKKRKKKPSVDRVVITCIICRVPSKNEYGNAQLL